VDAAGKGRKPAHQQGSEASPSAPPEVGGRSVDAKTEYCRLTRKQKELISRKLAKPSDGLEPSTPSLPSRFRGNGSQPMATDLA